MIDVQEFLYKSSFQKPKFRFAPTPSGYLHLGNGVNFALTWLFAKQLGADILLRIDDMDSARARPEYIDDVFQTLKWLGFDWNQGPQNLSDFTAKWSQKHRMSLYEIYLVELVHTGHVFPCKKSRKDLAAFPTYPAIFRTQNLTLASEAVAWRIKAPADLALGDFVLRRKNGLPSYQVTSLVDDVHFGISHLVRGADLMESSAAQTFLAETTQSSFLKTNIWHHLLVKDEQNQKLSKSDGATALRQIRAAKNSPEPIFSQALQILGLPAKKLHNSSDFLDYYLNSTKK